MAIITFFNSSFTSISKMSIFLPLCPAFCFIAPLSSLSSLYQVAISSIICCSTTLLTSFWVLLFTCPISPIRSKSGNVHMSWESSQGHETVEFLQWEEEHSRDFSFFSWSSFQLVPEITCSGSHVAILWWLQGVNWRVEWKLLMTTCLPGEAAVHHYGSVLLV